MLQKVFNWLVYLIVFLLPLFFLPFTYSKINFNKFFFLTNLIFWLFLIFLAKLSFKKEKLKIKFSILEIAVFSYFLITIFGYFFAKDKTYFLWGPYGRFWPSFFGISFLVILYFLIIHNLTFQKETIEKIFNFFIVSSLFSIIWGYFSIFGFFNRISYLKFFSWLKRLPFNPVSFGMEGIAVFGAFSIFVATMNYCFSQTEEKFSFKTIFKSKKIALFLFIFFTLIFLVLVNFKIAWRILALSFGCFLAFCFKKRIFQNELDSLNIPVFIFLFSLIYSFLTPINLNNLWKGDIVLEPILSQKVSWKLGANGLRENPFFGVGVGNFSYLFSKYKPKEFLSGPFWQTRFNRAGSQFAEILGTQGILAFLSFLAIFIVVIIKFFKEKEILKKENPFYYITSFSIFALFFTQLLFYQNIIIGFLFFLFLAIFSLYSRAPKKELSLKSFAELCLITNILFWALLLGCLFFSYFTIKNYIAEVKIANYFSKKGEIQDLEKATILASWQPHYHYFLSREYFNKFQQGQDPNEILTFATLSFREAKKAVDISPNLVIFQENLAVISQALFPIAGDKSPLELAEKSFRKSLELEPKNPFSLLSLAQVFITKENFAEAEKFLKKAIELKKDYFLARFQLANLYFQEKKYKLAEKEFLFALSLVPNSVESLYKLAEIKEQQGDKEKAIFYYQRALNLAPTRLDIKEKITKIKEER